jgi:hypothetical protein
MEGRPNNRARYLLRIGVQKSEVDLATQFLAKGGTLGGAAARGNTSFALSHADKHETFLLTSTNQTIDLPLSDKLIQTSRAQFYQEVPEGHRIDDKVGPHVLLSDRTRLNAVSTRTGAAINGTLVSTLAGTASVPLLSLFGTAETSEFVKGDVKGKAARPAVAFTQIPLQYPNWEAINATLGVCTPQIIRVAPNGAEMEVSALFFTPSKRAAYVAQVQPLIKSIYDGAWQMTKDVVFRPEPNLHKSVVSERDAGMDASGYSLAAAVNDTPPSLLPEVAEAVVGAAFAQELLGGHAKMLADLAVPSLTAATRHGRSIATALSAVAAFAMPYRVDGTPAATPEGLKMFQAESWPVQGNADPFRLSDDCDGQANFANQFIAQAKGLKASGIDMARFPNLRALANSIGAHYVHGMAVIAANAGHADAADASVTTIAGHAITTLLPKTSFAMAMQRGAKAKIGGKFVVDPQFERAVTNARWEALYPQSLRDEMPANEQDMLSSHEVASKWVAKTAASGPQPLTIEGTTFASAQLYEHDPAAREERMRDFVDCKTSLEAFSPNILRVFKTLDVCETGEHAFYNSMVETSFSPKDPLFTSGPLRSMGAACCHVRYAKVSPRGDVTEAGASPKDLATGEFALVPLWTASTDDGALIDEAHAEALSNTLPQRGEPITANGDIFAKNMATLREMDAFFHAPGKAEYDGVAHQALVSFASLVGNPNALGDFSAVLKANPDVRGEIYGIDAAIKGMAVNAEGEDLGRYIVLEVELPRK